MKSFLSNNEIAEITDSLVKKLGKPSTMDSVDIDRLAIEVFGMSIVYETIAEDDRDKIACTANGIDTIKVVRNRQVVPVVFPKDTIILDKVLQQPKEKYRRRYVLGHELGHVILGRVDPRHRELCFNRLYDTEREYTIDDLRERMNQAEIQANTVSCALLMPRFLLNKKLREYNGGRKLVVYGDYVVAAETRAIIEQMAFSMEVSYNMLFNELRKNKLFIIKPIDLYLNAIVSSESGGWNDK